MKKKIIKRVVQILILFLLTAPLSAFKLDGIMESYSGVIWEDGSWIRNAANLRLKSRSSIGPGSLLLDMDIKYDSVDSAQPGFVFRQLEYSHSFYFTKTITEIRLSGGLMQFSWGKSDELRILDVINPQDYNFSLFKDIADRQIGRLALSTTVSFGMYTSLQLVALPMERYSIFENSSLLPASMNQIQTLAENNYIGYSEAEQSKKIEDAGYAAKFTGTISSAGLDYGFYYYHGNSVLPAYSWKIDTDYTNNLSATREFPVVDMVGFAFEKSLSGFVIQGEVAWFFKGKKHQMDQVSMTNDVAVGGNGLLERDQLQYVVGFDHQNFIIKGLYFNAQFSQNFIIDHDSRIRQDAREDIITAQAKYDWKQKTYTLELNWLFFLRRGWMLNPELSFKLATGAYLKLGAYLIGADNDDYLLGNYDKKDFAYSKFSVEF